VKPISASTGDGDFLFTRLQKFSFMKLRVQEVSQIPWSTIIFILMLVKLLLLFIVVAAAASGSSKKV
jgi:hypothetical protein